MDEEGVQEVAAHSWPERRTAKSLASLQTLDNGAGFWGRSLGEHWRRLDVP